MKNRSLLGSILLLAGLFVFSSGCEDSGSGGLPKPSMTDQTGSPSVASDSAASDSAASDLDATPLESSNGQPNKSDAEPESTSPAKSAAQQTPPSNTAESTSPDGPASSERSLPSPPDASDDATADDATADDATADDATADDRPGWEPDGPTAEEVASKAFLPPPGATPLSKNGRLWIDPKRKRVYVDGYVALKRGPLEMFACPVGTKEHESIVAALAKSREVHAALLAVDATPGTPVRFRPEFNPPTGQVIRVWVCWYDSDNQFQTVDARQWIEDLETEKAMSVEWVFAGSGFWQDPDDKREYYRADSGDMICVSNFSSAMLDVAIPSSADADSLRFIPFESKIPDRETPVRLVLVPVPFPTASPTETNLLDLPTAMDAPQQK